MPSSSFLPFRPGLRRSAVAAAVGAAAALAVAPALSPRTAFAQEKKDAKKAEKPKGRHEAMDYGPFLTATVGELVGGKQDPSPKFNNAHKGIAIKLNAEGTVNVCFDTDLCRRTMGWTGGFLHLRGTPFDGSHGSWPAPKGEVVFRTKQGVPGWAKPGTADDFKDPRKEPYGPLPREWAHYKGLYVSGDKVVLKYTVGGTEVLELPEAVTADGATVFARTFHIAPTKAALTLLAVDGEPAFENGLSVAAGSVKADATGGQLRVTVSASDKPTVFTLLLAKAGTKIPEGHKPADLPALTKGGPARWTQTVETKGTLGEVKGPFVVDTLTVPEDNPYKAWMRIGGFDFFKDGKRAAVSTWSGDVWVVSGIDEGLEKLTWKRFATGLYQPLGLRIVDDVIYVNGRDQITRLHDLNGDGEADFYENFNNDHTTSTAFHEFVFDLQTDPEGNFYYGHAGGVNPGGRGFQPNPPASHHGCILKVYKDGSHTEIFATGVRAPNGIGVGPNGEVTTGDNEGTWTPSSRISLVAKGGFVGNAALAHRPTVPEDYDKPIFWLPHHDPGVDNSCGGQGWVTVDNFGIPKGTLLHTSYGQSSLFHVVQETVDGQVQGGAIRFPVNFLSGVMRPRFNPVDKHLYLVGLRGWQTNASRDGCFQRVRRTDKPLNTVLGLHVKPGAVVLTFSDPLDPASAGDVGNYSVTRWNYLWREDYGSGHYKPGPIPDFDAKVREYNILRRDRAKNKDAIAALDKLFGSAKGQEPVTVKSVKVSDDRKTVTLELEDLRTVMQQRYNIKVKAADGSDVKLDIFSTINKIPGSGASAGASR
jgi:hypothetical protein